MRPCRFRRYPAVSGMKRINRKRKPAIDFDLRQLEIFCRVVEMGSFSKAAEKVFLAQASVSERVGNLERMVGVRLLDRLGRQVVPTRAGERLYRNSLPLLEMKRSICLDMEDFLGLKRGEIRMGASTIPGEYILPGILGRFRKTHPEVSIRCEIADTGRIAGQVLDGSLEMGVVGSRVTDSRLSHKELWDDELVLAVPGDHSLGRDTHVTLQEVAATEAFILREEGSGTQKNLHEHLMKSTGKGIESLKVAARLGTSTAVKEGVKNGLGAAFLSYRALEADAASGSLKVLTIKDAPLKRRFYLIQDNRRTASPLCREMEKFLLATVERGRAEPHDR